MSRLAFLDTECTGLDPVTHEVYEVGLIIRQYEGSSDHEYHWWLPVDLGRADPVALRIGRFYERYPSDKTTPLAEFAGQFAALTRGAHLVGAIPSFDEERLRGLLRRNGACPDWHYHIIDTEALAVGYLAAKGHHLSLPWDSDALTSAIGVESPGEDVRHTALGDARWARDVWDAVRQPFGGPRTGN